MQDLLKELVKLEEQCFTSDRISERSFKRFIKKKQVYEYPYLGYLAAYYIFIQYSKHIRLYSIAVGKGFRNKGIAKYLIKELERMAKDTGYLKVTLECRENLVSFYTKLGYKVTKCLPSYYDDGSDGYKMEKKIA